MERMRNLADLYTPTLNNTKNLYLGDMPLTFYHREALNYLPHYHKMKFYKAISYQDLVLFDYLAHQSYDMHKLENEVVDKAKQLGEWWAD
tara:strand:+ start:94 stop:363 length:270 start_codon:yes stop_codon:yes gene_type:complete